MKRIFHLRIGKCFQRTFASVAINSKQNVLMSELNMETKLFVAPQKLTRPNFFRVFHSINSNFHQKKPENFCFVTKRQFPFDSLQRNYTLTRTQTPLFTINYSFFTSDYNETVFISFLPRWDQQSNDDDESEKVC
jgi:hypothetical protein